MCSYCLKNASKETLIMKLLNLAVKITCLQLVTIYDFGLYGYKGDFY